VSCRWQNAAMRKSFVQAVSQRSQKTASGFEVSKPSTSGASGEASLPAWVRKHEPRESKKPEPQLGSGRKQKGLEADCALALPSQSAKLLTVAEAAWLLNLSLKTVRRLISADELAVIRIGRSVRIHPEVIEKIMRQNE
jgi:excisionase family DNA binding protein